MEADSEGDEGQLLGTGRLGVFSSLRAGRAHDQQAEWGEGGEGGVDGERARRVGAELAARSASSRTVCGRRMAAAQLPSPLRSTGAG